jgi:hypothetical protein
MATNTNKKITRINEQRVTLDNLLLRESKEFLLLRESERPEYELRLAYNKLVNSKNSAQIMFEALDIMEKMGVKP